MKVEKPGDIEYTLTITMKAASWELLRDQLEAVPGSAQFEYPGWQLRREITDLLAQARKIYWPNPPREDG